MAETQKRWSRGFSIHERMMRLALEEAKRSEGRTSPNPLVGAVLVKKGRILARGHHRKAGTAHAEIVAIRAAGKRAKGATLYSTLEPCDHYGRTPPCTLAIIRAGIKRVVYASRDPNPRVNGKGRARLKGAGVEVWSGLLKGEADAINRPYFKFMRQGLPWVSLKAGVTLDGKLALATGESKWITGRIARRQVHELRGRVDAILVGRNTVERDDPLLTVRLGDKSGRKPVRVVVDSTLSLDLTHRVLEVSGGRRTIVAATEAADPARVARFVAQGVEVWTLPSPDGKVDLEALLRRLARNDCLHVLVEGGPQLFTALVRRGLADELFLFLAPKLLGSSALSWIGDLGVHNLESAKKIKMLTPIPAGEDVLLHGFFEPSKLVTASALSGDSR